MAELLSFLRPGLDRTPNSERNCRSIGWADERAPLRTSVAAAGGTSYASCGLSRAISEQDLIRVPGRSSLRIMILSQKSRVLAGDRRVELADARRGIDRRRALEAGRELFALRGFDGAAMGEIARCADLSLKALYAVFKSKNDLFEAVIADGYEQLLLPLLIVDRSALTPAGRVLALLDDVLAVMDSNRAFMVLYARGSAGVPDKLRAAGRDPYLPYVNTLIDHLGELIAHARPDTGPRVVRELAVAATAALVALAADAIGAEPPRPATEVASTLHQLLSPVLGIDHPATTPEE
jgi:AcrR family transcriptional regulator